MADAELDIGPTEEGGEPLEGEEKAPPLDCVTCHKKNDKKERKKHPTEEEAAKEVMQEYNPKSKAENKEYGGYIYKNEDGTYSRGDVFRGDDKGVERGDGTGASAGWHTHGDSYDPSVITDKERYAQYGDPKEYFSPVDMDIADSWGRNEYLATPLGKMGVYEPNVGKPRRIGDEGSAL